MLPYSPYVHGACNAFPDKLRFATKSAAYEYVKSNPIVTDRVRVYGCPDCDGFHFSHYTRAEYRAFSKPKPSPGTKLTFRKQFEALLNRTQ
jgi:hypothetical protein